MRRVLEFIGANLFLLSVLLVGCAVFWLSGLAIERWSPDPQDEAWAWAAAAFLAIAAMGAIGRWLHRLIAWFIARRPRVQGRAHGPA